MDVLLLPLTLAFLAIIFGVAGVAELLDLKEDREAVETFGAPKWRSRWLAVTLPILEISIAILFSFRKSVFIKSESGSNWAAQCFQK